MDAIEYHEKVDQIFLKPKFRSNRNKLQSDCEDIVP